jgi:hypothetical protein
MNEFVMYYDRDGQPMEMMDWARALEKDRTVEKTSMWFGLVHVSTVWLGLNHSYLPGQPPLIFETLVFFKFGGTGEMRRYSTEQQALQGHHEVCLAYRNPLHAVGSIFREWRDTHQFRRIRGSS